MTPVPVAETARLKAGYSGPFGRHTMLFHKNAAAADVDFIAAVRQVIGLMALLQWDAVTWDTADMAALGSNVFLPVAPWVPVTASSGLNPGPNSIPSSAIQFGGRGSVNGRRAKWFVYECGLAPLNDMRYAPGENSAVDDVVDSLIENTPLIRAIDGDSLGIYPYANFLTNKYLTRRARRG